MDRQRHRVQASRQQGISLLVGLIMLVLVTLLVLGTFHLGKSNLEIVGNVQHRNEALGAAQQTIEAAVSSPRLVTNPDDVIDNPCNGQKNTLCFDVNGDGTDDVVVTLAPNPTCVKANAIKVSNLDIKNPSLDICRMSCDLGEGNCDSHCADTLWDVRAEAQDTSTRTTAVINEGVATISASADLPKVCP